MNKFLVRQITLTVKMAAIPDGKNAVIPPENVIIGVPKKGRLYDRCMKLLTGAGLDHRRVRNKRVSWDEEMLARTMRLAQVTASHNLRLEVVVRPRLS